MIQTLLFVAGINTLLQSYFGTRLPTVIGGSFTFVVPTLSIVLANRYSYIVDPQEVKINAQFSEKSTSFLVPGSHSYIISFIEISTNYERSSGSSDNCFKFSDYYWL